MSNDMCLVGDIEDAGKELLDYLRAKTFFDPKYAVLTGIMHAGKRIYEPHQAAVDILDQLSPTELTDKDIIKETLKLNSKTIVSESVFDIPEYLKLMGNLDKFAELTSRVFNECYIPICNEDGKACLCTKYDEDGNCTDTKLEELTSCLANTKVTEPHGHWTQYYSVGPQTRDVVRMYMGDKKNVPIDTHVMKYLCDNRDIDSKLEHWCNTRFDIGAGGPRNQKEYDRLKEAFLKLAEECKEEPDKYQVSVWLRNMCKFRKENSLPTDVRLALGLTVDCDEVVE